MNILYCDSCGIKLPELDVPSNVEGALCEKCAAARGLTNTTPTQVAVGSDARKSSSIRLRAIETTSAGSDGPTRRTPVGTPVIPVAKSIRPKSSARLRAITPDSPSRRTPAGATAVASSEPVKTPTPPPSAPVQSAPSGSMGFYFCEKCGKRVTDADLAKGQGRDKQVKGVHCAACADGTMTVSFDAITQADFLKEDQKRRQGERHSTSTRLLASKELRRPHRSSNAHQSTASTVVVVVVVAVFSAVLGLFLIGRSGPGPSLPSASKSTASASTVRPASSSSPKTAPSSAARPAARQLAEIRTMITADLREYAKVRQMLDQFSKSFAGTPEAQDAKALRAEVEERYTKLAEESLEEVLAAAKAAASKGAFYDAELKVRSIEVRFGQGAWFESKGKAAVEEALAGIAKQREAWELKNVAGTLDKARKELQAGRLEEANKLIADRAKWLAETRTQADELAAEIERKVTEAAAARMLEQEGEAALAEFDRLMIAGKYAEARAYAKSKATIGGAYGKTLGRAERLAGLRIEEPETILRGARELIKQEVQLKTTSGIQEAIVKTVTADGLAVATTYKINNQTLEKDLELKWSELHRDQKAEFARLGGIEMSAADEAILAMYAALASDDLAAAEATGGASEDPLGVHLTEFVKRRAKEQAYESAMARARELVATKDWKDVAEKCRKALEIEPGDKEATELLAKAEKQLLPPTLTLNAARNPGPIADPKSPFRYYRFTPIKLRGQGSADSVHLAELQFFAKNNWTAATTVTNPGGRPYKSKEAPSSANDNDVGSNWLDHNKRPLIYDFGSGKSFDSYNWATAKDVPQRDPIRWKVEGSNDGATWTILDDKTGADQPVPDARKTWAAPGAKRLSGWTFSAVDGLQ